MTSRTLNRIGATLHSIGYVCMIATGIVYYYTIGQWIHPDEPVADDPMDIVYE